MSINNYFYPRDISREKSESPPLQQTPSLIALIGRDVMAAFVSVTAYHPLRTLATKLIAHQKIQWQIRTLYQGFLPGMMGAHQLFLMSGTHAYLSTHCFSNKSESSSMETWMKAALAGGASALTTTPFDNATVQKQLGRTASIPPSLWFRGFVPQFARQTGIGLGLFAFPERIRTSVHVYYPQQSEQYPGVIGFCCNFAGGALASALTQVPEIARTLMQKDLEGKVYPQARHAFKAAFKQMAETQGMQASGIRMGVLVVATVTVNGTRDLYTFYVLGLRRER